MPSRRQSLVSPIDWKPRSSDAPTICAFSSRHSLVTPIDWKPCKPSFTSVRPSNRGRQSLVTPIDWKLEDDVRLLQRVAVASPIRGDAY